jgi:hypothetical protein
MVRSVWMITLKNMDVIDKVFQHIKSTHRKIPFSHDLHAIAEIDELHKVEEGYKWLAKEETTFLHIRLVDNTILSFSKEQIEDILSVEYKEHNVNLNIFITNELSVGLASLTGRKTSTSMRLIAEIGKHETDEVVLDEQDIRDLIEIALLTKDRQWFNELSRRLNEKEYAVHL